MSPQPKPKIVILGGGFGGLEAAFYLRWRLAQQADITLVSDRDHFLFKPNTIYIPFGLDPEKLTIPSTGRPGARGSPSPRPQRGRSTRPRSWSTPTTGPSPTTT